MRHLETLVRHIMCVGELLQIVASKFRKCKLWIILHIFSTYLSVLFRDHARAGAISISKVPIFI